MNKIIDLEKVLKIYKRGPENIRAVDRVSISVEEGEFLVIIGPSGSGKTTLLNLMGCVDNPTTGSIRLNGNETGNLNDRELTKIRASSIGFIFQQFFLLPTLTALENVALPALFSKKNGQHNRAKGLLHSVGLGNREAHFPSQLSGGEMQRVAIARALMNNPKILLADEPTGNIDSKSSRTILGIMKELNERGLTIIMVTHDSELAQSAGRRICMHDGKVTEWR
jgi:putative ABC transport system ATP-binding protein